MSYVDSTALNNSEVTDARNLSADTESDQLSAVTEVGCSGCIVLTGARYFDGNAMRSATLVLEGQRIKAIVEGTVKVVAGTTLDLTGQYIVPGLMDMHVHSFAGGSPFGFYPSSSQFERLKTTSKSMLRYGVTSYLDLGASEGLIGEYRRRIQQGTILGPSLFATGPFVTATGGHPCYDGGPALGRCIFVDQTGDAEQILSLSEMKPDALKVVIEAGSLWVPLPRLGFELLPEIKQMADSLGVHPIAHVSLNEDVSAALDSGIRHFAHIVAGESISDELVQRLAALGAVVVPTLVAFENPYLVATNKLPEMSDPSIGEDLPQEVIDSLTSSPSLSSMQTPGYIAFAKSGRDFSRENFKRLLSAGVTIMAGTDSGVPGTFGGRSLFQELQLYVSLGMKPLAALKAATHAPAEFLGLGDRGKIQIGAVADLLVLTQDPSIAAPKVDQIHSVYLAGKLVDREQMRNSDNFDLSQQAPDPQPAGDVCFDSDECGGGLTCSEIDNICVSSCNPSALVSGCPTGHACLPGSFGAPGYCLQGDGCDPLKQDCENGAACYWLGNGATRCLWASAATDGQACAASNTCSPGHQCSFTSGECAKLCDPKGDSSDCPDQKSCVDQTAYAGLSVGECQ